MSSPDELLSFKEFLPTTHNSGGAAQINLNTSPKKQSHQQHQQQQQQYNYNINDPDFLNSGDLSDGPMKSASNDSDETSQMKHSFFTLEYYQKFFNVDTVMVIDRIVTSMIPKRAPGNYLKNNIGLNPDLYGPFWIVTTLIFSIAISGNIANYLHSAGNSYHWRYNFHLVSVSATAIIFYACMVPIALWAAFKWTLKPVDPDLETDTSSFTPNLLAIVCIYGYSLSIYIPVSILWVIPLSFLQWLLMITATLLSGSVLVFTLTPALRNSKVSLFIVIGIIFAHFMLAAGFMLYFFHAPPEVVNTPAVHEVVHEVVKEIQNKTAQVIKAKEEVLPV